MSKLPSGVFRCVLEYQFPKVFAWRYSDPYEPLRGYQNKHFPDKGKLDYENYLVAVNKIPGNVEY